MYKEIAEEFGISEQAVKTVAVQMAKYIEDVFRNPKFDTGMTKEEFLATRTSIKMAFFGDFYIHHVTYRRRYNNLQKRKENEEIEEGNTEIYKGIDNSKY